MMGYVMCFIAAMLAGIFVTLVCIRNDIRKFIDDMYEFEENNYYKED